MIKNHPNEEEQFEYRDMKLSKKILEKYYALTPNQRHFFAIERLIKMEQDLRENTVLNYLDTIKETYK